MDHGKWTQVCGAFSPPARNSLAIGYPGFPVQRTAFEALRAAFLNESRTNGRVQCSVPEIRASPLFSVADSKLPPPDPGGDNARVLTDSLKFIPVLIDHEGVASSKHRSSPGESACAIITIQPISARCHRGILGTDVAVLARIEGEANIAFPPQRWERSPPAPGSIFIARRNLRAKTPLSWPIS
jgi:hypothetical protein